MRIDFKSIEAKWKSIWDQTKVYEVTHRDSKPKYYVLDMFPYPSGSGLHVGHPLGYVASDILSRYKRMSGFNVLHPMGFDAFGLPAEQYAIQTNVQPSIATDQNISRYKEQLSNIGFSYDWSREVRTCDPDFYQWTQWIFLQLFDHYFDLDTNKALPISALVERFEKSGTSGVNAASGEETLFTSEEWHCFSPKAKDDVLMNYRLAFRKVSYVNWCEALGTVLANDEVKDGVSERGGYPVERRAMIQWSLRVSAYAERLLNDLDGLDWTDSMKAMQSNWIGRSEGAQLDFQVADSQHAIRIFTTRPDTIYGSTFMVIAPEHPLVDVLTTSEQLNAISQYKELVKSRSERDRLAGTKQMTGAFTGSFAVNPFTQAEIPIWIADYVLMEYGTGAIMAVPGDDTRDLTFAKKFNLPIVEIIDRPVNGEIGDRSGKMINSDTLNDLTIPQAIAKILDEIVRRDIGSRLVQYKMRDAIYSRQRYWGEPIPIYYDDQGVAYPLSENALPLLLPELDDFKPGGSASPLARLTEWVNIEDGTRDTDTMPGYAGSSWYYLRYMDPKNNTRFAGEEALNYWQDVDLYIGGTEHAVGHLMYARFWHKFLYDKGLVPTKEPFRRLVNQGMIQGVIEYLFMLKEKENGHTKFLCATIAVTVDEEKLVRIPIPVTFVEDYGSKDSYLKTSGIDKLIEWRPEYADAIFECTQGVYHKGTFTPKGTATDSMLFTQSEVGKMGKRYHNAVDPNNVVALYGADCFRMYEMFLGPLEQAKPWDTRNIDGVSRFMKKFWSLFFDEENTLHITDEASTREELRILHLAIRSITSDIDRLSLNTCISHFMTVTNELKKLNCQKRAILEPLVLLIAPFAPFVSEEIWEKLGHQTSVHLTSYPEFDPSMIVADTVIYPVCINGKKRTEAEFATDATQTDIEAIVLGMESVQKWLEGVTVKKVVIVPGRMINIVV